MSVASTPARSIALFEATTARSMGERALSLPPKVPKGVRTAERKTIPVESLVILVSGLPSAIDAELPHRIQLRPAACAMLGREILPAVRAVDHLAALGQRPSAELAALDLGRQRGGHSEGGRFPVASAVAVAAGVATGIL